MPTFDVPISVTVEAEDQERAWDRVRTILEYTLESELNNLAIVGYSIDEPEPNDLDDWISDVAADEAGVG
jgi:hypothetical protein